eukprot:m.211292 g.211292  ORF g.211292 m.211292 type:complete len:445 (+) comp15834_c0_seq1:64-1398(+)
MAEKQSEKRIILMSGDVGSGKTTAVLSLMPEETQVEMEDLIGHGVRDGTREPQIYRTTYEKDGVTYELIIIDSPGLTGEFSEKKNVMKDVAKECKKEGIDYIHAAFIFIDGSARSKGEKWLSRIAESMKEFTQGARNLKKMIKKDANAYLVISKIKASKMMDVKTDMLACNRNCFETLLTLTNDPDGGPRDTREICFPKHLTVQEFNNLDLDDVEPNEKKKRAEFADILKEKMNEKKGKEYFREALKWGNEEKANCFSGASKIRLQNGKQKQMSDLCVGDFIQDAEGEFVQVFAFLHRDTNQKATFKQLETDEGVLTCSSQHYVFTNKGAVPASNVALHDKIRCASGDMKEVVSIKEVEDTGVYAPLTTSGTLVVNNLQCSCYADYGFSHEVAHGAMFPWRLVHRTSTFLGASTHSSQHPSNGISTYPRMLLHFVRSFGISSVY